MFTFEIFQMMDKGWSYLNSIQNLIDQSSTILILLMVIKNDYYEESFYNIRYEQIFASFVVF